MSSYNIWILRLFRLLVGCVFIVAGQLKLYQSLVGYLSAEFVIAGVNVSPWLAVAELITGLLLLAGIAPFVMTLVVVSLLCSFVSYSAVLWSVGTARCGCFGHVPVAPGHVLVLDLGLLAFSLAALRIHLRGRRPREAAHVSPAASRPQWHRLAMMTSVAMVLLPHDGSSLAAETSQKDRFLHEYPAAQAKLVYAATHAEGEVRYLRTDDQANRQAKNREAMKWGGFRFIVHGDSLRIDQTMPGGGTAPNVSLVLTPNFNFRVLSPNSPSAQIADVSTDVRGKLASMHALYWRDFFPACYLFAEARLDEWMKRPGFRILAVEADSDHPDWVRLEFDWDGMEWFADPQARPADYLLTGALWLSPAEDWAIRKSAYRQSMSYSQAGEMQRDFESVTAEIDVQNIPDLGFVPRKVVLKRSNSSSDWNSLTETLSRTYEFESVRKSTADAEVFTPAALGVSDPRSGLSVWFILLNVGIVLLLLLVSWVGWRRRQYR